MEQKLVIFQGCSLQPSQSGTFWIVEVVFGMGQDWGSQKRMSYCLRNIRFVGPRCKKKWPIGLELWPGTWICTPVLSQFNASWDSSQTSNQPNSAKMRREWSGVGNGVRAHNLRASSWRHRRYKLFILNSKRFYRSQKNKKRIPIERSIDPMLNREFRED